MKKIYLFAFIVFLLLQKAFPQAAFSIQGNMCQNSELNFIDESLVPVTDWNWDFGDGNSSTEQNPTYSYADTGTFLVRLTITSSGNNYNTTQNVNITAHPTVLFNIDSVQFMHSSYTRVFIDSSEVFSPVNSYVWDFGDGSVPVITQLDSILYKYSDKGSYTVWLKVVDSKGCSDSVSTVVDISDRYYIPNVFTPNGDNMNDQFIVTSNGVTLFSIVIYSRWGNLIFQRTGHEQIVWDGRMPNGSLVKPGTYYYVINSESGSTTYDPEAGFITVFY